MECTDSRRRGAPSPRWRSCSGPQMDPTAPPDGAQGPLGARDTDTA